MHHSPKQKRPQTDQFCNNKCIKIEVHGSWTTGKLGITVNYSINYSIEQQQLQHNYTINYSITYIVICDALIKQIYSLFLKNVAMPPKNSSPHKLGITISYSIDYSIEQQQLQHNYTINYSIDYIVIYDALIKKHSF